MHKLTTIEFNGDTIFAIECKKIVFVAMRPICQSLGLDWSSQYKRMQRDVILSENLVMMTIPSVGGAQETACLPIDMINGWLFGVDDKRIADESKREKILTYKRECYQVLHNRFFGEQPKQKPLSEGVITTENDGTKARLVTECRHTFGAKSSGELWFKLGLPITPSMLVDPRQLTLIE